MNKIRIKIENIILLFRLLMNNSVLFILFIFEVISIMVISGIFLFTFNTRAVHSNNEDNPISVSPESKNEVSEISPDLFYSEKAVVSVKPVVVPVIVPDTVQLNLTGIGNAKGINKATIEDSSGNYYYVQEGDYINGLLVKKITENEVLLIDQAGKQLTLVLDR